MDRIRESSSNPRRVFDEAKLRELADNIKSHGVLQAVSGLILMILIFNVTGRIKHYHHEHIIMISWYWHFVDAVWVVVFTVVYVIGGKS